MAISSINFAKSSSGSFAHNDRTEKEPGYLLPVEHRLENECNRSAPEAQKMLEGLFENAKENYSKTYGQKFQTKFENTHWEAVINLNKEHTIKDVERLVRAIEKETGFTSVQIAIHRDEGRINEKTEHPIHNLHAHVNFFTLDSETGQQLYRRSISNSEREKIRKEHDIPDGEKIPKHLTGVMDKAKLSKLQDITAEVLGMERGEKGSKAVRLGHKQYKVAAQEKEQLLEKIEELQKENAELRYSFRDMQKQITALELATEEKKELHRLNTEINKTKDQGEKDEKIKELEEKISSLSKRIGNVSTITAEQIIDASKVKSFMGADKIDETTLKANLSRVLDEHNAIHKESLGIFATVKEKIINAVKHVVESSKTALKTIFSAKEEKSSPEVKKTATELLREDYERMKERKKGSAPVETEAEAKARRDKWLEENGKRPGRNVGRQR